MASEPGVGADLAPRLPLNVLLVEDNPDDAECCLRVLRQAPFEVRFDIVTTREEFTRRVQAQSFDVILTDYDLGTWTGTETLELLHDQGQDIPVILVTGALGDEKAVECITGGISDYVLKDRLERLPLAIVRAVEKTASRVERQRAERLTEEREPKFRALAEAIPAAIFIEEGTHCRYTNRAAEDITGYSREELLSMYFWQLLLPNSRDAVLARTINKWFQGDRPARRYEVEILTKQNLVKSLDITVGMFPLDSGHAALITAFDISGRKKLCTQNSRFQ